MDIKLKDIIIGTLYKGDEFNCPKCGGGYRVDWYVDKYGEPCVWEFKLICEYCQGEFSIAKTMMDTFIIF